jgi:hypothetical protein
MAEVGIDTSVLIGLLDPKDVWHGQAVALKLAHPMISVPGPEDEDEGQCWPNRYELDVLPGEGNRH